MAEIRFYAQGIGSAVDTGDGGYSDITHDAGSGLGFYGSSIGVSVPVAEYQTTTYHTNGDGTDTAGATKLKNTQYATSTTVKPDTADAIDNDTLANFETPLNVRFTHTEPVAVQNVKLRIFDRNDIAKAASGVDTRVYEARHPMGSHSISQLGLNAGAPYDTDWTLFNGDSSDDEKEIPLTAGPGVSGSNTLVNESASVATLIGTDGTAEGASHKSMRHDWYMALSASPESIGSKTSYGLYFTLEYL